MSFSELLDAVMALPPDEKQQLLNTLQEERDVLSPEERIFGKDFPVGNVFEVWFP